MKFLAKLQDIYTKHYKKLMLVPLLILILSGCILVYWKASTGEFVSKDISLKGGLLISVKTDKPIDVAAVESKLESELGAAVSVKALSSIGTRGTIGYTFETESNQDRQSVADKISKAVGVDYSEETFSVEEVSPILGETFWQSTVKGICLAFIFMSIAVFVCFRKLVPSLAIMLASIANLAGVLAIMDISGIPLSGAGVAALLMLIGYAVDSNILLSIKAMKRGNESTTEKILGALRTGLTTEGTSIAALAAVYIVAPASSLKTIALVLIIGLFLDLLNTWVLNSSILRIYLERKGEHG